MQREQPLPAAYRDHALVADYQGFRECHVQPGWRLIYRVNHGELILVLQRTGWHADLL
ncbi:MAG: type II toxin-antitoxin system mRNA interferase toxin, RelE/StbE family [Propionibacteriaceae bacterium]|nr:type II toxin-antitoxin system mRNA interferase toxin, RelE/StbE family [Propionibacteriaceae bacterium]